jgi:ABC-type multidrug transport system fused ATPase/permease subunit
LSSQPLNQHALFERQIHRLDRRLDRLKDRSERFIRIRVGIVGLTLIGLFLAWDAQWPSLVLWGMGLLGFALFIMAVRWHRQTNEVFNRHLQWRKIKREHQARLQLDWAHMPPTKPVTLVPDHPFAGDLDLTGERSIHRLLDTTHSYEAGQRLADWLLDPVPDSANIHTRQALVKELRPLRLFRDKLSLNARMASDKPIQAKHLTAWFTHEQGASPQKRDVILLVILALVHVVLFGLMQAGLVSGLVWLGVFSLYFGYLLYRLQTLGDLFGQAMAVGAVVGKLNQVFALLERYPYGASPRMKALCQPFWDGAARPSAQLRRIALLVSATSLRGNPFLWFFLNAVFPWDMVFAYLLYQRKRILAAQIPQWLDVWFEVEALSALASFAQLNPDYIFPTVDAAATGFAGTGLGHPLIPADERVCNDFSMGQPGEVVIITGSNMAGKSSFLRTLGVNLRLAYAGGVVSADALTTGLFRLFAVIKVNDSVTDGFSYFYAEVRRLRQLLDALDVPDSLPVLFLIDEIFKGTNNRERLIGSRAYIRALRTHHGLGLVSTHDLELVHLAEESPNISNVHFREEVVNGEMVFDYRLRPGPCPTSNALKIMALEGLPVDPDASA